MMYVFKKRKKNIYSRDVSINMVHETVELKLKTAETKENVCLFFICITISLSIITKELYRTSKPEATKAMEKLHGVTETRPLLQFVTV